MSNTNEFDDINKEFITTNKDYIVIKQIGKGSFSKVYLCKKNTENAFAMTELFSHSTEGLLHEDDGVFIIKEINVNTLVERYVIKNKHNTNNKNVENSIYSSPEQGVFNNITPYTKRNDVLVHKNLEYDYYYQRLQGLIESEIEILKKLEHPNIIGFFNYTTHENIYKLHMEYCNRGDVYEILKNGVSPNGTRNAMGGIGGNFLCQFIKQISHGLFYLHEQNIIHRDIKLHNVLLKSWTKENEEDYLQFKISDFGFACFNLKANPSFYTNILGRKYYKLCGSPYYMAPEIVKNIRLLENFTQYKKPQGDRYIDVSQNLPLFYDTKCDMYSFGMCLYELIFNQLPLPKIKDITELENFYKSTVSQQSIDQRIFRNKHINTILQELIAKLLRVDSQFRFSAEQIVDFISKNEKTLKASCQSITISTDSFDNSYLSQADLKQHVVNAPIDNTNTQNAERGEHSSWHYINNSNSLIRNIDAERGFLDWLMRNTKQ